MNLNAGASQWRVQGMTCQNCSRQVREAAQSVAGVASASVDLGAARLRVRWEPGATNDAVGVVKAVTGAGFEVSEWVVTGAVGRGEGEPEAPGREWRGNVLGAGGVSLFLALAEWVFGWGHTAWFPWVAGVMAGLVQGWAGARFYRGAWNQLKRGAANMDTLVSLGSTAAFAHSAWILVAGRGGHVHFLDSTAIIALISVGHWMEALASSRAAGAIRALMELSPARALRVEADGSTRSVPAEDVLPGDRVVVGPGDRVPADAEIVEGAASLDESMLTGESVPVERKPGDRVWGGTLNQDGRVVIRVTASGDGTVLAGIIAAVERAQGSRADIQRLADRISSVFVPVVVGLA
ncbi:MAG: cation-translocating P-type ATPase, partial [Verrucomicrobiales bacterium]|nr:cation-translocating P-type ATPase [Verrucomicrobiales bacterium]